MRDGLTSLTAETFDLLIVGAGIHGACAARAAARMGLRVALVDQDDFGAGTSANSLKVIHGGLRYLQHANVRRMRESIRARRRFLYLTPHLVRPQAFALPTSGAGMRGRAALRLALALNDLVSFDRNKRLLPEQRLPAGRVVSAEAAREIWPGLPPNTYDGAAVWHDALCHNTERMTLSFVLGARAAGAAVANYVRAERVLTEDGVATGVEAREVLTGNVFSIKARAVLDAAGPWWRQWGGAQPVARPPLVGAWNLLVRSRWFGEYGVGLESVQAHHDAEALLKRGRRNLFFVPWRDGTMIGTVYEPYAGDPSAYKPSRASIESFVGEINGVLPDARLSVDDISLLHVGVQPAAPGGSPEPDKHSAVLAEPVRGLFSIKGVKYTTGLTVGERAAQAIARVLGKSEAVPCDEPPAMEQGDVCASARARGLNLPAALGARLSEQYGPDAESVLDEARADAAMTLPDAPLYLRAEVRHAVKRERAVRLADVVLRRTDLGTFAPPGAPTLRSVAEEMTALLGWSAAQQEAELRQLAETFSRLTPHA